jgi:hypothetical protein
MSAVSRYAGDGNFMTPIGKTWRRFPWNLVMHVSCTEFFPSKRTNV